MPWEQKPIRHSKVLVQVLEHSKVLVQEHNKVLVLEHNKVLVLEHSKVLELGSKWAQEHSSSYEL